VHTQSAKQAQERQSHDIVKLDFTRGVFLAALLYIIFV